MKRGFTLIELIVVIIIVGILGALGISQYSKTVEKGRGAEARMILGQLRTFAYQYRLENGSINGISKTDLNIGSASNQIPDATGSCRSTHYFAYGIVAATDPTITLFAARCPAGGKTPQGTAGFQLWLYTNFSTGADSWENQGGASY